MLFFNAFSCTNLDMCRLLYILNKRCNREQMREVSGAPLPLLHAEIVHVPSAAAQLPVKSWLWSDRHSAWTRRYGSTPAPKTRGHIMLRYISTVSVCFYTSSLGLPHTLWILLDNCIFFWPSYAEKARLNTVCRRTFVWLSRHTCRGGNVQSWGWLLLIKLMMQSSSGSCLPASSTKPVFFFCLFFGLLERIRHASDISDTNMLKGAQINKKPLKPNENTHTHEWVTTSQ